MEVYHHYQVRNRPADNLLVSREVALLMTKQDKLPQNIFVLVRTLLARNDEDAEKRLKSIRSISV